MPGGIRSPAWSVSIQARPHDARSRVSPPAMPASVPGWRRGLIPGAVSGLLPRSHAGDQLTRLPPRVGLQILLAVGTAAQQNHLICGYDFVRLYAKPERRVGGYEAMRSTMGPVRQVVLGLLLGLTACRPLDAPATPPFGAGAAGRGAVLSALQLLDERHAARFREAFDSDKAPPADGVRKPLQDP